jgi:hypothetical protein
MNKRTATAIDKSFYAEYDACLGEHGVFGDSTGFCYGTFSSRSEAEEQAMELNQNPGAAKFLAAMG